MPAASLQSQALAAIISLIDLVDNVGDMPYEKARHFLVKVENPKQLHEIEQNSPHIVGEDAELWRNFVKRDIPNSETDFVEPKDPSDWYSLYKFHLGRSQREIQEQAKVLKAATQKIQAEEAKRTSKFVEPSEVPKLPRMGGMRREKPLYTRASRATGPMHTKVGNVKRLTGPGMIDAARRSAAEISRNRRAGIIGPSYRANAAKNNTTETTCVRAKSLSKSPPTKPVATTAASNHVSDIDDLFEDRDGYNSIDELFEDKPAKSTLPKSRRPAAANSVSNQSARARAIPEASSSAPNKRRRLA